MRIRSLWKHSDGRDWLWGNLGFALMGGAMLSNSLINFILLGKAVSLPIVWPEAKCRGNVGVMAVMAISFKMTYASLPQLPGLLFSALYPAAGRCPSTPLPEILDTHRQVWLSPLWGRCSFLLGPGAHEVFFVPFNSLFPQACASSVIKSHWSPKSNSHVFSVPLPDPQAGKSIVGPRTFATMWELLWV